MILNRLQREAADASARYGLLTHAWRGIFLESLNDPAFGTGSHMARLNRQLDETAQVYLTDEIQNIERLSHEIATEAHQTTIDELASASAPDLSDVIVEHLRVTQQYLIDEISAQLRRDAALIRNTVRRVILEVTVAARSRRIPERTALLEYRIGNQADLQFTFFDRDARKWMSKKFIHTLWRHTMLSVYNEIVMTTLADHGIETAVVWHQDGKAEVDGLKITFGSNNELPTYSEIRDAVFHPNANAYLTMESSNVSS